MSLSPQEQFKKFLENSKEVLILLPENPSLDAISSSLALYCFLEKKNILSTIASPDGLPQKFSFLPYPDSKNIVREISGARDFVLSFDTSRNKIIRIREERSNSHFNLYVTPEKGSVDPRDFSFILAKYKYDLVIVIGCSDLEKLGNIYAKNADLFFEIPIVNIDYRSDNDNFGQINLVDVTASSSSEILLRFLESTDPNSIDKNIANCLLAGLIGETDSFQKKNTTPRSLAAAASLMEKGADQQEIIRWLYKTQPLHILKLWGRAMAKINWDENARLAWSALSVEDFVQSRSTPEDLPLILEKLQENYSEGKIFMVVYNDTLQTSVCLVKTASMEEMKKVYPQLDGNIKRGVLEIKIENPNLIEVGRAVAEKIK